jgi:hypothetical protein
LFILPSLAAAPTVTNSSTISDDFDDSGDPADDCKDDATA